MSYRQDNFNLMEPEELGRPLRPFNWVQWTGVALEVIGAAWILAYIGAKFGWIPAWVDTALPGPFMLIMVGGFLISSRREPMPGVTEEQLRRNRKTMLVTTAILFAIFGAVLVIEFSGA